MSPIAVYPVGSQFHVTILADGTLTFPQRVLEDAAWQTGMEIAVQYIDSRPFILLFAQATPDHPGFTLSALNRSSASNGSSGKITCSKFHKEVLRGRLTLPMRNIQPIIIKNWGVEIALIVEPFPWESVDFSKDGVGQIAADTIGVYQLLSFKGDVLRVGQGLVQARLDQHLQRDDMLRAVETLRYVPLAKEDAVITERLLLEQYESEHGELPTFNTRRS